MSSKTAANLEKAGITTCVCFSCKGEQVEFTNPLVDKITNEKTGRVSYLLRATCANCKGKVTRFVPKSVY